MSRGPGRWQRVLLDALEHHDLGTVGTIVENHLGRKPSREELVAARRAVRRLVEDGRIEALHLGECVDCGGLNEIWRCSHCGAGCREVLVVARLGMDGIRSVTSLGGLPAWVSVALGANFAGATLRKRS